MAFQSGSRGKGSRRGPWRDGGARKSRPASWQKQAAHASKSLADLPKPVVTLLYLGKHHKNPGEKIYVLDQLIARAGIPYLPIQAGRWAFRITVPADNRVEVEDMIARLQKA